MGGRDGRRRRGAGEASASLRQGKAHVPVALLDADGSVRRGDGMQGSAAWMSMSTSKHPPFHADMRRTR